MKKGWIFCVFALWVAVGWAQDKAPKKFHTSAAPPHHSLAQVEKSEHARSNASSSLPAKTQSARNAELSQLEHKSSAQLRAQSAAKGSSRPSATASHVHAEPTGHSSSINFNYHAPHNQSAVASGGRKH